MICYQYLVDSEINRIVNLRAFTVTLSWRKIRRAYRFLMINLFNNSTIVATLFLFFIFIIILFMMKDRSGQSFSSSLSHTSQTMTLKEEVKNNRNIEFIQTFADDLNKINKYELLIHNRKGTFKEAFELFYQEDYEINIAIHNTLMNTSFDAIFWECTPINKENFDTKTFEFVVIDAPKLAHVIEADVNPFIEHFKGDSQDQCERMKVTSFHNLGRDSLLVVPCPLSLNQSRNGNNNHRYFSHLLSYIKGPFANNQVKSIKPINYKEFDRQKYLNHQIQVVDLFKLLGQKIISTLETTQDKNKNYWISTSGLGVSWLHIRIDSYPKYYNYNEYKIK